MSLNKGAIGLKSKMQKKKVTSGSGARRRQVTFPWLEPLLFLCGITSVPPLLLRLLLRLLRVSGLLQRSVRLLDPKPPKGSACFQIAAKQLWRELPPPALTETGRAVTLRSKCGRRSRLGLQQVAMPALTGTSWPLNAPSLWGGHPGQKSWALRRQSRRVPSATQRRNMECWPAYRCVKLAETIEHLTSANAFSK